MRTHAVMEGKHARSTILHAPFASTCADCLNMGGDVGDLFSVHTMHEHG